MVTIRKVDESDYESFFQLIRQFRETSFSFEQFVEILKQIRLWGEIWVLLNTDGQLVATGTIYYEQKFIFNCAKLAHIEDVCVNVAERRKGYGKQLVLFLKEEAQRNGCYKVTLDCTDSNIAFYESCGFEKRGNQMSTLV